MELNAVKQTITACRGVKECREEIPFDCGMTLPDYYPDVMKILRCGAEVFFGPPSGNQGGAEVSGTVTAAVCYLSEEGRRDPDEQEADNGPRDLCRSQHHECYSGQGLAAEVPVLLLSRRRYA